MGRTFDGIVGLAVSLAALLSSAPALASGSEHGAFGWTTNGFYIIDFLVFVAILVWFGRKPLTRFLRQRRDTLEQEIVEAQKLKEEARVALEKYQAKLAGLDAEVEGILARAHEEGESLKARLVRDGEIQAEKLKADAEARVRQEVRLLREQLEAQLVAQAVSSAEALIQKKLTPMLQRKYIREYVHQVEHEANAQGSASDASSRSV